jgi:tetratricopeptide (TPR) repeat protein
MAELRDKKLFMQPDGSHRGACPICCLPLPLEGPKSSLMPCCSKSICNGCDYANTRREIEAGLEQRCAFCREPFAKAKSNKAKEEADKKIRKRIKKNCPVAMSHMGMRRYHEGDYETALEYWTKAAGFGDAMAHYSLFFMYLNGFCVEKDKNRAIYHLEGAAIAGHPAGRHLLGHEEVQNGRFERAKKHWIIAANLGWNDSLTALRTLYADGHASKEEYADALRAYQAAVDATKSQQREDVQPFYNNMSQQQLRLWGISP